MIINVMTAGVLTGTLAAGTLDTPATDAALLAAVAANDARLLATVKANPDHLLASVQQAADVLPAPATKA